MNKKFRSVKIISPKYGTYYMLVSPQKYHIVVDRGPCWNLLLNRGCDTFYAARYILIPDKKRIMEYAHRLVMNCPKGLEVDHINHNGLDNRDENLRIVTHAQNTRNNESRTPHSSIYKGVSWEKSRQKWSAQIMVDGKYIHLGRFNDELNAAFAYNQASLKYHGEHGLINIIEDE